jgi:lipopolysaccharide export LptBFGC system permease protein LptF
MSSAYTAARLMSGGSLITNLLTVNEQSETINKETTLEFSFEKRYLGPLLNPALGFGQALISLKFDNFLYYLVMPFVGSALALIFYEYVYVRSQEYLNEDDDVTDNNSGGDLSLDSE